MILVKSNSTNLATYNSVHTHTHINGKTVSMVSSKQGVLLNRNGITFHDNLDRLIHTKRKHVNNIIRKNDFRLTIDGVRNKSVTQFNHRNILVIRQEAISNNSAILTITEALCTVRKDRSKSNRSTKSINISTAIGKFYQTCNFYSNF
nr:MAG TPA: hypothetical protein [Caudoviricetes sp.]